MGRADRIAAERARKAKTQRQRLEAEAAADEMERQHALRTRIEAQIGEIIDTMGKLEFPGIEYDEFVLWKPHRIDRLLGRSSRFKKGYWPIGSTTRLVHGDPVEFEIGLLSDGRIAIRSVSGSYVAFNLDDEPVLSHIRDINGGLEALAARIAPG